MSTFWHDSNCTFNPVSAPDYLPIEQLRALQLHRLQAIVRLAYEKVPQFSQRLRERGLAPQHLQSLSDITLLPFSTKADLRDAYPTGLLAVPMEEVVRIHASSGTTGKPIIVAYTQEDIQVWISAMIRTLACHGLRRGDILQNAHGYGLFTGGLGVHYGAEALGATVVPISGGNTDRQIMIMKDLKVTAIICTPSYFVHIIERAKELGIDFKTDLSLRLGGFGAEPWSEGMRGYIQRATGIRAHDIYGLSEITGPGVGTECAVQQGIHIFEDHFYPEVIHPRTGEVLPDGEEGELVLTTLSKKAMPMIRYRTRDITAIIPEPCPCGRTLRRIHRIRRRSDDMLIIRGVNVFPSQIETALLSTEGTLPHYQILLTREKGLDQMEVQVEVTASMFSDQMSKMEHLRHQLAHDINQMLGIHVKVTLVEPHTLQRSEGKAKRVIDKRGEV